MCVAFGSFFSEYLRFVRIFPDAQVRLLCWLHVRLPAISVHGGARLIKCPMKADIRRGSFSARPSPQLLPLAQEFPPNTDYFSDTRTKRVRLWRKRRSRRRTKRRWWYLNLYQCVICLQEAVREGGRSGEGRQERQGGGNSSWSPAKASLPAFLLQACCLKYPPAVK